MPAGPRRLLVWSDSSGAASQRERGEPNPSGGAGREPRQGVAYGGRFEGATPRLLSAYLQRPGREEASQASTQSA